LLNFSERATELARLNQEVAELHSYYRKPRRFRKRNVGLEHETSFASFFLFFFVCLLPNGTSALFRLLVPRIVEVEHTRHVKNDRKVIKKRC